MIDVGYCINGKRGVISNVMQISNHATDHLVFENNDGEQYALKKTDIEYVIPHECLFETLKTNKEKFEEVFGIPPKDNLSICDIVDCNGCCESCKFYRPWIMRNAWDGIWRGKES